MEIEKLIEVDSTTLVNEVETHLLDGERVSFQFKKGWAIENFPKEAGVYAIFRKDKLIYFGQTANLKERMGEMHRTYMHSLRKKLGRFVFKAELIGNKYSETVERKLDELYENEISVSFLSLALGRLEIESHLIKRHPNLMNSPSRRTTKPKPVV